MGLACSATTAPTTVELIQVRQRRSAEAAVFPYTGAQYPPWLGSQPLTAEIEDAFSCGEPAREEQGVSARIACFVADRQVDCESLAQQTATGSISCVYASNQSHGFQCWDEYPFMALWEVATVTRRGTQASYASTYGWACCDSPNAAVSLNCDEGWTNMINFGEDDSWLPPDGWRLPRRQYGYVAVGTQLFLGREIGNFTYEEIMQMSQETAGPFTPDEPFD